VPDHEKRQKAAGQDTNDSTGSEKEDRSKAMEPKVSLYDGDGNDDSTSGIEEAAEASVQTTGDEEGSIQSNKDSEQKSPFPSSIQSYTHTKPPKKFVSSEKSNKQRTSVPDHEKRQKAAGQDTDDSTGSEREIVTKTTKTESDPQRHHPR
jgi:hypothetical protein